MKKIRQRYDMRYRVGEGGEGERERGGVVYKQREIVVSTHKRTDAETDI